MFRLIKINWDNPLCVVPLVMALSLISLVSLIGRDPLTADETETWGWAGVYVGHHIDHTAQSFHPPAYYFLLGIWVELVGDSPFQLRLPSTLLFVATIPVVYAIGRIVHSSRVGLVMIILVATSPFVLENIRDARAYSTLLFAAAVALLCATYLIRNIGNQHAIGGAVATFIEEKRFDSSRMRSDSAWLGFVLFSLLVMFVHFMGILFPPIVFCAFAINALVNRKNSRVFVFNLVIAYAIILALWIVHPFGFLAYILSGASPGLAVSYISVINGLTRLHGGHHFPLLMIVYVPIVFVGLSYWWKTRQQQWFLPLLVIWLLIIGIAIISDYTIGSVFRPRTFIWALIPFYVVVSVGLVALSRTWIRMLVLILILLVHAYSYAMTYNTTRVPWDQVASHISRQSTRNDIVLVCPWWMGKALAYDDFNIDIPIKDAGQRIPGDPAHIWLVSAPGHRLCFKDDLDRRLSRHRLLYTLNWDFGPPWPTYLLGGWLAQWWYDPVNTLGYMVPIGRQVIILQKLEYVPESVSPAKRESTMRSCGVGQLKNVAPTTRLARSQSRSELTLRDLFPGGGNRLGTARHIPACGWTSSPRKSQRLGGL